MLIPLSLQFIGKVIPVVPMSFNTGKLFLLLNLIRSVTFHHLFIELYLLNRVSVWALLEIIMSLEV